MGWKGIIAFAALSCVCVVSVRAAEPVRAETKEGWKLDFKTPGVAVYSRPRPRSTFREFKGVGTFNVPPAVVNAVLQDRENYPKFVPHMAECRVLKRDGDTVFVYQRLDVPIFSDRDYIQRVRERTRLGPNGQVYEMTWRPANDAGPPPPKGVVRLKDFEGSWVLEPEGAGSTRMTFYLFTDTGSIPRYFANRGTRGAIMKTFSAIRKRLTDPKYRGATGPGRTGG